METAHHESNHSQTHTTCLSSDDQSRFKCRCSFNLPMRCTSSSSSLYSRESRSESRSKAKSKNESLRLSHILLVSLWFPGCTKVIWSQSFEKPIGWVCVGGGGGSICDFYLFGGRGNSIDTLQGVMKRRDGLLHQAMAGHAACVQTVVDWLLHITHKLASKALCAQLAS